MPTIRLGNSYSKITGLTPKDFKDLSDSLSYIVGGQFYRRNRRVRPRRRGLLGRHGDFPTGLLGRVVSFLDERCLSMAVSDDRIRPETVRVARPTFQHQPYAAQVAAVRAAVRAGRGIVSMPTGCGKSHAIAMLVAELSVRTLVVVPTVAIREQLRKTLGEFSDVVVENIDSPRLKTMTDFGCLIIDEAHHVSARTYRKLNRRAWTNIYYRFFFTATPFRNDVEETLLFESIAGDLIYELSYTEAVRVGYVVPVDGYYVDVPVTACEKTTWREVYDTLIVDNSVRNRLIVQLLEVLTKNGRYTLCLVKEVRHGEILAALSGLPFAHGDGEDHAELIRRFCDGDLLGLIATETLLGEGVDTKPCEYVIIAGLGKAKSSFMQKAGRAVRRHGAKDSAKIVLFRDASHRFTLRHFKEQNKIMLEEYATRISLLVLEGI